MSSQDYLDRFFPLDRAPSDVARKVWQSKRKLIAAYFEQIPPDVLAAPEKAAAYARQLSKSNT